MDLHKVGHKHSCGAPSILTTLKRRKPRVVQNKQSDSLSLWPITTDSGNRGGVDVGACDNECQLRVMAKIDC